MTNNIFTVTAVSLVKKETTNIIFKETITRYTKTGVKRNISYMPLVCTSVKVPSYKLSLHPMYFVVTALYRPTPYRETKS